MENEMKQLEMMLRANQDIVRMIKRGFYPASVSDIVQRALNYLNNLTTMTKARLLQLQKEAKNAPKAPDTTQPVAAEQSQVPNDQAAK